jgi:alpha-L-fucosidase
MIGNNPFLKQGGDMRVRYLLFVICLALLLPACSTAEEAQGEAVQIRNYLDESPQDKDQRMQWWRNDRFGMFIHWGLYSVPAGEYNGQRSDQIGEWIQSWANIPEAEYVKFAEQFDPVDFDAAEWVRVAKEAGMKYIVITSKHHEGFSMFDSKFTDFDIVDATPYGRDPIAALSRECRKQEITLGFYYSIMDWHHPSQYVDKEGKDPTAGDGQTKIHPDQKQQYIDYMKAQLKELVTRYDPAILWFDGEWVDWWTEQDGKDLYNYVRSLKPSIIINNRVGKGRQGMQGMNKGPGFAGDFGTPEQEIPATGLAGVDWESCMTMNDTWGYKSYDDHWKSAEQLVRNLIDIASKGGNYLLNVGPTAQGKIPQPSVERLQQIGEWMDVNGEAIYGTGPSPFSDLSWGRATTKEHQIFLMVFDWPKGRLKVPPVSGSVTKVYLLAHPDQELQFTQQDEGLAVTVPAQAPDPIASVIVLEHE